jgi:hypothetical protein
MIVLGQNAIDGGGNMLWPSYTSEHPERLFKAEKLVSARHILRTVKTLSAHRLPLHRNDMIATLSNGGEVVIGVGCAQQGWR